MTEKGNDNALWLFSQLSMEYILNVCCVGAVDHLLRLKISANSLGQTAPPYSTENKGFDVDERMLFDLKKKAVKELYSLLALENLTYRERLQGDIFDYLRESDQTVFHPWGYFDFRLSEYQRLAEKAVDHILNQYWEQRDYQRCLKLIGETVSHADRRLRILHVIFLSSGGFLLLNEQLEVLEREELRSELDTAVDLGLKLDDVLAAAFLFYAPERIVVHNYQSAGARVSAMVWDLAGVPVKFCTGCAVCRKYIIPVFADV